MILHALVAFDALLHLIAGLAFVPRQLDAVDAAVAHVDQVHIIDEPAEEPRAAGGVRADAIALQGELLLVRVGRYYCERHRHKHTARDFFCAYLTQPLIIQTLGRSLVGC